MKCKDCEITGCPNRGSNAVFSKPCNIINQDSFDWQSFRAEAAKDILCAMINHFGTSNIDMNDIVKWTDSLISKLREEEKK